MDNHSTVSYSSQVAACTSQLISHLHRGGALAFIQAFEGDKRRSAWYPVGKPLTPPAAWATGQNLYFGVNPSSAAEPSKWVFKDGKKDTHGTYHASTNDCIAALNCLYAEFDGKDFTQPTQDEITAQFEKLKAAALATGGKVVEKALWNQALGAAKDASYQASPDHYKKLAKQHVDQLQPRPSVIVFSGGGWQAYWLLRDTFHISDESKRNFAKELQSDWVRFVGGDPGAKDLRRILRLPGYKNYKAKYAPNYPTVSYEAFDLDQQYNLLDLAGMIPPKPVEQPKATTQRTATATGSTPAGNTTATTQTTQTAKHGLIDWFNDNTPIASILGHYGYTGSGDRLSRPGQPESNGVHIFPDNRSYHHSSNDPMWNDDSHKRSPFDVYCVFEHDGNVKAAANALAAWFFGEWRLWARSNSFEQHIDPALRGQHYRTDATDTKVADAVFDILERCRSTSALISLREGGKLAGVSHNTFGNALQRLGFLFDVYGTGTNDRAVILRSDFACCTLNTSDILGKISSVQSATSKNEYTPHKADEVFMSGVSQHIKRRVAELAKVLEITDREAKEAYTLKALGETMLRCFDAWQRAGEMTVSEFAEETGKKIGSIRTALQYAVRLELATYEQETQKAPKVYSFSPDFWLRVDELRPNLRTYSLPEQRENARLKQCQRNVNHYFESRGHPVNFWGVCTLDRYAAQRKPLLEKCYADQQLPPEIIERIASEFAQPGGFAFIRGEKMATSDSNSALRSTVSDLKEQGVKGKDLRRMLAMAGYTQTDLRPSIVGVL